MIWRFQISSLKCAQSAGLASESGHARGEGRGLKRATPAQYLKIKSADRPIQEAVPVLRDLRLNFTCLSAYISMWQWTHDVVLDSSSA